MLRDQDGNPLNDGDWVAFNIKEMARGSIVFQSDGGIQVSTTSQPTPGFINVVIQIPADPQSIVRGVSKVYGPYKAEPPVTGS